MQVCGSLPVPAATPPAPRYLLELVGPAELASIASEIACIDLRHHEDPGGGAQLVDNELLSALGARRRLITRQLRPDGGDYPGRPPSSLTLRVFRNRIFGDFTALLASVGASAIDVIFLAIRNPEITEHRGVAVAAGNPRRRRSGTQILLDKERRLVELRKDLAAAEREIERLEKRVAKFEPIAEQQLARMRQLGGSASEAAAASRNKSYDAKVAVVQALKVATAAEKRARRVESQLRSTEAVAEQQQQAATTAAGAHRC